MTLPTAFVASLKVHQVFKAFCTLSLLIRFNKSPNTPAETKVFARFV